PALRTGADRRRTRPPCARPGAGAAPCCRPSFPGPASRAAWSPLLVGEQFDRVVQNREELVGCALLEVDAQHAPPALAQRLEVAAGLGGEERAEAVVAAGDGQLVPAAGGELQADPGVGRALVKLAGAVEEAGADSGRAGEAGRSAGCAL